MANELKIGETAIERRPHPLAAVDWAAPWLVPWRATGEPLAQQIADGVAQPQALNQAGLAPVRFVAQSELPPGCAYEQHIFETQCVPTRDGLHDFFNGLCWLHFPLSKTRLNQLQAVQIARTGVQAQRGPTRDALTVFDENAALLRAPDALWDALVAKNWPRLFIELRPLWRQAQLLLFGHALLEKLVAPRKAITAHVYRVRIASNLIADIDTWLAQDLRADKLAGKPFAHLPVLGVPGWCAANEDPAFYADASVFRWPQAGATGSAGAALECP